MVEACHVTDGPPFIGRAQELAALASVLELLQHGRGQSIVVEGEPGIGKSRLVAEALDYATTLELRILAGSANELERDIPFGVMVELLDVRRSGDERRARILNLLSDTQDSYGFGGRGSGLS
jgi:predicted ATPase